MLDVEKRAEAKRVVVASERNPHKNQSDVQFDSTDHTKQTRVSKLCLLEITIFHGKNHGKSPFLLGKTTISPGPWLQ
jgi:hypothetical protein